MNRLATLALLAAPLMLAAEPALAHHVMGGVLPSTFATGLLSGLGHPVIGPDHFAAVVAVGCLAAAHRAGPALVVAFVLAMMGGVALHVMGTTLPGAEIVVAGSVLVLGLVMLTRREMTTAAATIVFAAVGLVHGYALGESIAGAEPTPLYAYLLGLAVIQSAVALAAMAVARVLTQRQPEALTLRLVGAGIAGAGVVLLMQQAVAAV